VRSSRPFRDLNQDEADKLKALTEHPGWGIFLKRLHWTQAEELQAHLDSPNERSLGRFEGLKRAEKLAEWMILEPEIKQKLRRGEDFEVPYEGVTAEDIEALEDLPGMRDAQKD